MKVVDLSQRLGPDTIPWAGSEPLRADVLSSLERGDGAYFRRLELEEHLGTHIDAPAHFFSGGRTVDDLRGDELVQPAFVVDCRDACGGNADYVIRAGAIEEFEREHGRLPERALVLACTGWDVFRDDGARYLGDPPRFPGFGIDAARRLLERGVAAIGIDTLGVDPGQATDLPVHHLTSPAGVWHIEGLVNLDRLPPTGATVVVGALPLVDGSGTPARVLALIP